ncbi:MAG: nuclear transport factor 2 family protein [Sphingobium sp.]
MSADLIMRVARLEAHRDIERLIADLGHAFDSGPSAAALLGLFTDDALFEIDRYGALTGAQAIAEGVAGNAGRGFRWTLHYLVSPRIDLSDDAASASLSFMLWEAATSASGRAYWIGGSYDARAVSGADRWRFTHLRLKADLISHYPEGWHDKPDALDQA